MTLDNRIKNLTVIFGLATLVLTAVMVKVFPSNVVLPEGFNTAVIAFEFAQSEADVAYLIGDSDDATENRQAMRDGHKIDMFFPFAYAGFLALLLLQLVITSREPLATLGLIAAILIIPFDINENLCLLAIVDAAESNTFTPELFSNLYLATWLKWVSICLSVFVISLFAFKQKQLILGLFGLIYVGFTCAGIITMTPQVLEIMAVSLAPFLLTAFVMKLRELSLEQKPQA